MTLLELLIWADSGDELLRARGLKVMMLAIEEGLMVPGHNRYMLTPKGKATKDTLMKLEPEDPSSQWWRRVKQQMTKL